MAFRARLRVRFSDIDYAGIVYYPRFLHYLHVAMEEFFGAELHVEYPTVLKDNRIGFPTVHIETDFRKPLHYGDRIDVEVRVLAIGTSSITWGYTVLNVDDNNSVTVEGKVITVSINLDTFIKITTPEWLKKRLDSYRQRCM